MAEATTDNPGPDLGEASDAVSGGAMTPEPRWSELWQVPALILGILMLAGWWIVTVRGGDKVNDFDGTIRSAGQFLLANDIEHTYQELNKLLPEQHNASPVQQAMIKRLWADARYIDARTKGIDNTEEWEKIVTLYGEVRELGLEIDGEHLHRWADSLASLGRDEEAIRLLEPLGEAGAAARYALLRRIIERQRQVGATADRLVALIGRFQDDVRRETDPKQRRLQEIWVARLQGELYLEGNDPKKATDYLTQRMGRFVAEGGDEGLAPLMITLGQAYYSAGNTTMSRRMFQMAQQKLLPEDPLNAQVLVGLGRLDLTDGGDVRSALSNFTETMNRFPTDSPSQYRALIGRADCEARLGSNAEAVEHFKAAVQMIRTQRGAGEARLEELVGAVRGHYDANMDRHEYQVALDYLQTLLPLYANLQELPPRLLLDMATTLEHIAQVEYDQGMGQEVTARRPDGVSSLLETPMSGRSPLDEGPVSAARQMAFQQAAGHFEEAAGYYVRHAHAVANKDEIAYGLSLWRAAAAYDRAQLWAKTIDVYGEFIQNRPSDPRQLVARLQLGQAFEAARQHEAAVNQFQLIQSTQPRSPEAYASLVPMARCLIALRRNDEAERILRHVVTNHPTITPDSEAFRQAIIELSSLYYRDGRFTEAIPHLSFAVERYQSHQEAPILRYRLADAYRRSVEELAKAMEEPMPQSRLLALEGERARRLEEAIALYTGVITELESRPGRDLTPMETLYFRNAFFYRADCAYDLRRFEQAIQLYEIAARRWENHPSSLVAMVQIVNSNAELGRVQDARVATRKAQALLKRIPEDLFDSETVPMSRKHWEEWLRWTSELNLFDASSSRSAAVPVGTE